MANKLPWLRHEGSKVMNWLCVEVRYLFDKYHGSRDGGRRADYPPSAHRIFQALTAAASNGRGMSDAAREALQWLEKQSPPQIIVPKSLLGSRVTTFVPNNDMNVVAKAWAKGREPEKKPENLRTATPSTSTSRWGRNDSIPVAGRSWQFNVASRL